jgi:hypothetical protein
MSFKLTSSGFHPYVWEILAHFGEANLWRAFTSMGKWCAWNPFFHIFDNLTLVFVSTNTYNHRWWSAMPLTLWNVAP